MKEIQLTKGKVAIVDDCDFEAVSNFNWFFNGYAARRLARVNGRQREQKMHRFILSTELDVDHINGNKLDNRRENLRPCNAAQNRINCGLDKNNTSGFRGVSKHKQSGGWVAFIGFKGKTVHIGWFNDFDSAKAARIAKEIELYGDFSPHKTHKIH